MNENKPVQQPLFPIGEGDKRKVSKAVRIRQLKNNAENLQRFCVSANADYERLKELIEPFKNAMKTEDKIGDYVHVGELTYPRTSLKEAIKRYESFESEQCYRLEKLSELVAELRTLGVTFKMTQGLYPDGGC